MSFEMDDDADDDLNPAYAVGFDEMVYLLLETRERIAQLKANERHLIEQIHQWAPSRKVETQWGLMEVTKRRNKKWDHEEATKHVVSRALDERIVDPDTGEVEPSWQAVTRALRECAGISYWRMGALQQMGLQPDEFYEVTSEAPSVHFR